MSSKRLCYRFASNKPKAANSRFYSLRKLQGSRGPGRVPALRWFVPDFRYDYQRGFLWFEEGDGTPFEDFTPSANAGRPKNGNKGKTSRSSSGGSRSRSSSSSGNNGAPRLSYRGASEFDAYHNQQGRNQLKHPRHRNSNNVYGGTVSPYRGAILELSPRPP